MSDSPVADADSGLEARGRRTPLWLATVLVVGLVGVVPLLTVLTDVHPVVWVIAVGTIYALLALWLDRVVTATVVALVVSGTVGIRTELAPVSYLGTLPGRIGPILWLFLIPLLAGAFIVLVWPIAHADRRADAAEITLGGVVAWAAISTVFANPVRPDTAFYFSAFLLQGWLALVVVRQTVSAGWLEFEDVVGALSLAVLGNAVFGLAQVVNQGVFRLRRLGEIGYGASNPDVLVMRLPIVGAFNVGAFVSGLTTDSYALATLLVLVFPILVLLVVDRRHRARTRLLGVLGLLLAALVLRATRSDAARGGVVIGLACLIVLTAASGRLSLGQLGGQRTGDRDGLERADGGVPTSGVNIGTVISTATVAVATGFVLFTEVRRVTGGAGVRTRSPTATLSPRLEQYAAGVDLLLSNPLFGIGGGNFQYVASSYGIPEGTAMHSIYLLVPVETGLPALGAFCAFLLVVLRAGWSLVTGGSGRTEAQTQSDPLLLAAGVAGVVAVLAMAGLDHLLLDRPTAFVPFCALCGAVVGASRVDVSTGWTNSESSGSGVRD